MNEDIREMIQKVVQGKFLEAQETFSNIVSQKALAAMQNLKVETAKQYYNKGQE